MNCPGCDFFLVNPDPAQHYLCSRCFRAAHAAPARRPQAAAALLPLRGGVLSIRSVHQMCAPAAAAAAAHGLNTMLCGFFAMAACAHLAQRFPRGGGGGGAPPRLTRAGLAALCAELADPAVLLPHLDEALAAVVAGRRAFAALHGAAFLAPNTDEAAGEVVSPTDERTLRGYLGAECAAVDLSTWLRARAAASPQAASVGLLRPVMARFAAAQRQDPAAPPLCASHLASLQESEAVLQGFAGGAAAGGSGGGGGGGGGGSAAAAAAAAAPLAAAAAAPLPPYAPRKLFSSSVNAWEAGWFVEVHPQGPCAAAAGARAVPLPARPELALPAGAAVPLLPTTPSLPWLCMVDAAQLNGHFNAAFCFTLEEGGQALQGAAAAAAAATAHLLPGFYTCVVESLHAKCRAHWKYAEVLLELQACVFGSWYCGGGGGALAAGAPPCPPALGLTCAPCDFDACGACAAAAGRQAQLHEHSLTPLALGGPRDPARSCNLCGQRMGPDAAAAAAAAAAAGAAAVPVACCAGSADGCAGPVVELQGHTVHLQATVQHPNSTEPGF